MGYDDSIYNEHKTVTFMLVIEKRATDFYYLHERDYIDIARSMPEKELLDVTRMLCWNIKGDSSMDLIINRYNITKGNHWWSEEYM